MPRQPDPQTTKTIRVRIAIAISPDESWAAYGYWDAKTDKDIKEGLFFDGIADGEQIHWIEADVPVPFGQTIQGEVT